jgi:selenide,water dikinase
VVTADFITPVVDEPRTWGRIAAANSASDVYAMGGRPVLALNLVGWNTEELPTTVLVEVLEGAAEVAADGGWVTVGGHTVDDPEPKFGLAVVGEVHPHRLLTNTGLRAGEALVLTKALGTGIISTALKRGEAPPEAVRAAVASMTTLNALASEEARRAGARGATDVTGFGLLGHLLAMAQASKVGAEIDARAVAVLPEVGQLAAVGHVPGGTMRNIDHVRASLDLDGADEASLTVLADAQTSGGLIFGAEPDRAREAVEAIREAGQQAAVVGRVVAGPARIRLLA